jgi:hypothetical protein
MFLSENKQSQYGLCPHQLVLFFSSKQTKKKSFFSEMDSQHGLSHQWPCRTALASEDITTIKSPKRQSIFRANINLSKEKNL